MILNSYEEIWTRLQLGRKALTSCKPHQRKASQGVNQNGIPVKADFKACKRNHETLRAVYGTFPAQNHKFSGCDALEGFLILYSTSNGSAVVFQKQDVDDSLNTSKGRMIEIIRRLYCKSK